MCLCSFVLVLCLSASIVESSHWKREAAVWGESVPSYAQAEISYPLTYLHTVIFVDDNITAYYEFDMHRVKEAVMQLAASANAYLYQLKISLVVLDVFQTMRSDLSLYTFVEYRNQRLHKLPEHDIAVLLSHKYAGGLAFVGGICTKQNAMLCGFYPNDPAGLGSIFFHEIAHLVGVPHRSPNSSLYVPNCSKKCQGKQNCLKIPAFEHSCTAQSFVNLIPRIKCLKTAPMPISHSLSICGNGLVEWLLSVIFLCAASLVFYASLRFRGHNLHSFTAGLKSRMFNCFKQPHQSKCSTSSLDQIDSLTCSPYQYRKQHIQPLANPKATLLQECSSQSSQRTATLQRPNRPSQQPPHPPKATLHIDPKGSNFYEVPTRLASQTTATDQEDRISWKFDDFDSEGESSSTAYRSYIMSAGIPTVPTYPSHFPISRVTVNTDDSGHTTSTDFGSSSGSSLSRHS
ncbi:hypothetical protein WR25_14390 [Diploscapter pachys]|uniref:Peptidase M12B domain-containing protein n=1 Tax=Diploscapter pachys TaxID=2018661 RepID=A0A2A2LHX9_9BILA|nr:hypothetical protein WR25_14390 [Diploscapter pachys]